MRGLLLRRNVFELTTPHCHGGIFQHFWSTDQKINFSTTTSTWKSLGVLESWSLGVLESWSYQQSKEFFSETWVFFQARTIWEPLLRERRAIYSECRVRSEMANYVNFARRMRLPALYFQLGDHIPTSATMASYQTSVISLGVQPPTNGREPDDFQSRAQIKRLFEERELVSGDSEAFRKFSDKYISPEKLAEERGDWKGANGTAELGVQWHWLGWTVQLR